jgi:hypothetical protein
MCGATEHLSAICRVIPDKSKPTCVSVQIALQNRSTQPWINATFDVKPNDSVSLVSRSLPNPFAVAAGSVAPLLCVFEMKKASAPVLVEGSFSTGPEATAVAASFRIEPSLFVIPKKISLDDLGRLIAKMASSLKSASANVTCQDQAAGLKKIAERINLKKVRIDNGAALFYGVTAFGVDVFAHMKRSSETTMVVEIKSVDQALSKSLVEQAVQCL